MSPRRALVCWHCGALIPLDGVRLDASRWVVRCLVCHRDNSLEVPRALQNVPWLR